MHSHRARLLPALPLVLLAVLSLCSAGGVALHADPVRAKEHTAVAGGGRAAVPAAPAGGQGLVTAAVRAENALRGTSAWRIRKKGSDHEVEGFADRVSVLPGESFRLFVSTTSAGFQVEAFRVGWYRGAQARRVWASPNLPGGVQAPAKTDPVTGAVSAPWHPSLTVPTTGWPEGSYLLRLTAGSGAQRYVPITVRSPSTAGKVVVLNATTTWQAYNRWGGYNLYQGPSGSTESRAHTVSFDRPYDDDGAEKFMSYERDAIVLAEKTGVPLAYETDNDLHAVPGLLQGARALLTLGHDEYWSTAMRNAATAARDTGVNLAFLGANAVNRHIRFGRSRLGADRLVTCYKDAGIDPFSRSNPKESTQDWRLPPYPRPESALIGVQYNCFPAEGAFTVVDPGNWLFQGTGVRKGTAFPGMVGPESDAINWAGPTPRPLELLAHSPILCGNYMGQTSDATYYTAKSGAGVVAMGTMRWVCAMRGPRCGHGVTAAARRFVRTVTGTLLVALAEGPLGLSHPAKDTLRAAQS